MEEGKLSGYIVIDKNIFNMLLEKITDVKILVTVLGKDIVFRNKGFL